MPEEHTETGAADGARTSRTRPEPTGTSALAVGRDEEFRADLERVRFSSAFSRLAEVTQVVSAGTTGGIVHNRLTHTIKVTSVARAIAVRLELAESPGVLDAYGGLHHVVAQIGACAHDLGHPPFGHLGEQVLDRLAREEFGLADGFEGNAQTFRILTELEVSGYGGEGLNLTAAGRASVLKYPWGRYHYPDPHPSTWPTSPRGARPVPGLGALKFNAYVPDLDEMAAVRDLFPEFGPGRQTLECAVMDLADDIAYSLHDLEDFHRSGVLQFSAVASEFRTWAQQRDDLSMVPVRRLASHHRAPGFGLEELRRRLAERDGWIFDDDAFLAAVARVGEEFVEGVLGVPYDGRRSRAVGIHGELDRLTDRQCPAGPRATGPRLVRGAVDGRLARDPGAEVHPPVLRAAPARPDPDAARAGERAAPGRPGVRRVARRPLRRGPGAAAADGPDRHRDRRLHGGHPDWLDGQTSRADVLRLGRGRGIIDFVAGLTDHQAEATAARLRGGSGLLWGGGSV